MRRGMDDADLVAIERLNSRGEGVAADGRAFPFALPGEMFRPLAREPVVPSLDRIEPICKHFTYCGGCSAQHMGRMLYASWKRGLVLAALENAGVKSEVEPLVDVHGAGRRRAAFHARFLPNSREVVGFMRARSHEIIEIDACPLFEPGLQGALGAARALAADLRGLAKPLDIQATATLTGLDIDVRGTGALEGAELKKIARTAEAHDLARVSNHGRTLIERRAPEIRFDDVRVKPPAGGFLQATLAGEAAMAALAGEALKGKQIADLFCGSGAFALRLGVGRSVYAADADAAAIAALNAARANAPGLERVQAETRDLFQRPLRAEELRPYDGVIFDPPRAGALAQAKEIAASGIAVVVAVSCNVETFARDARVLVDGGYSLARVTPLDQFRFSSHVEIVAVFRRRAAKRRRGVFG
jgi:23S rRNA (uracil1939-C5)-methyltransferase